MELNRLKEIIDLLESGEPVYINDIALYSHIVTKNEEMRIDLVSYNLYDTEKYITELTYLNGITNVFSIKEGDKILYPSEDNIDSIFKFNKNSMNKIKDVIFKMNKKKSGKLDKNRLANKRNRNKTEQNKRMPPNILNNDKMVIENGKLVLKSNF